MILYILFFFISCRFLLIHYDKLYISIHLPYPVSQVLLTLVYTRALRSTINKRLRSQPVDTALDVQATPTIGPAGGGATINCTSDYIDEICATVAPCDLVLNSRPIGAVLHVLLHEVRRKLGPEEGAPDISPAANVKEPERTRRSEGSMMLPLVYVKIGELRIFAPSYQNGL